ncbi:MAG TPA: alkaline phosphatase family protein [Candidatus Acidoferrales bacterium]|nr:alkaline phosphatase family protein [Candidatus Acidoferrales bacterium]
MNRLAVINVVGLTETLIGEHTPRIAAFRQKGALTHIAPAFPAVTCTAQSNYLTGTPPAQHGIVGNGWYERGLAEVQFWKQSNHLVQRPKIWDALRRASARGDHPPTVSNCFWWFNMYSTVDYSLTPRPIYRADGAKIFDIYSWPYSIRTEIKKDLGDFPFFAFWGPAAGVKTLHGSADCATRWIAEAAKWMESKFSPTLNLVYLPHLDYNLQRHGPFNVPVNVNSRPIGGRQLNPATIPDLRSIDDIAGELIQFFESRGVGVVLLSEYGLINVDTAVHLNRIFREHGWLALKDECGSDVLDAGASRVFAVADHQVAHIYLNDPALENTVRDVLEKTPGLDQVLGADEISAAALAHPRTGDLLAVAAENAWFTYYYWLDDARAPDFARTIDIHRKPGYDPVELFLDSRIAAPQLKIAWRLLQKRLGFRMLMDVIPLDATLVRGSHGRRPGDPKHWPVIITNAVELPGANPLESTEIFSVLQRALNPAFMGHYNHTHRGA